MAPAPVGTGAWQFDVGGDLTRLSGDQAQTIGVEVEADDVLGAAAIQVMHRRARQTASRAEGAVGLYLAGIDVEADAARSIPRVLLQDQLLVPGAAGITVTHRTRPPRGDVDLLPQDRPRIALGSLSPVALAGIQATGKGSTRRLIGSHCNRMQPAPGVGAYAGLARGQTIVAGREDGFIVEEAADPGPVTLGAQPVVAFTVDPAGLVGQHGPGLVVAMIEDETAEALEAEEVVLPQIPVAQHQPGEGNVGVGVVAVGLGEGVELAHAGFDGQI